MHIDLHEGHFFKTTELPVYVEVKRKWFVFYYDRYSLKAVLCAKPHGYGAQL
jgi:hypothetical protein